MSHLMMHSTNPRFAAKFATFEDLTHLPTPQPLGPMHQPIPHHLLVEAFRAEADKRGFTVARETFALAAKGLVLFGVMDLATEAGFAKMKLENGTQGISLGLRASNNLSISLQAVAGTRVFVCDNLAFSGDIFAVKRKHTVGLDLGDAVATGFDKFVTHVDDLATQIATLDAVVVPDDQAKAIIYDVFAQAILPARLFDDVDRYYFQPAGEMTDCHPRTKWGIHNAMTRALRDVPPARAFNATIQIGRALGMTRTARPDVIDVTPIALE